MIYIHIKCFSGIPFIHRQSLLVSQGILIMPFVSSCAVPFCCAMLCFFNVWFLPLRTFDELIFWFITPSTQFLRNVLSATVDFFLGGLNYFLGGTFISNFYAVGFLFLTDGVAKLQL